MFKWIICKLVIAVINSIMETFQNFPVVPFREDL